MIDYPKLKAELATDPLGLGYAGQSEAGKAALLNARAGPSAAAVPRAAVPLSDPALASLLAYALPRIRALPDQASRDYYTLLIQSVTAVGCVYAADPNVAAAIAQAVTDGVITPALAAAVSSKTGSRAEVLFGDGAEITWQDVKQAES